MNKLFLPLIFLVSIFGAINCGLWCDSLDVGIKEAKSKNDILEIYGSFGDLLDSDKYMEQRLQAEKDVELFSSGKITLEEVLNRARAHMSNCEELVRYYSRCEKLQPRLDGIRDKIGAEIIIGHILNNLRSQNKLAEADKTEKILKALEADEIDHEQAKKQAQPHLDACLRNSS